MAYLVHSYHFFCAQVAVTFAILIAFITPDFQQANENHFSFAHFLLPTLGILNQCAQIIQEIKYNYTSSSNEMDNIFQYSEYNKVTTLFI